MYAHGWKGKKVRAGVAERRCYRQKVELWLGVPTQQCQHGCVVKLGGHSPVSALNRLEISVCTLVVSFFISLFIWGFLSIFVLFVCLWRQGLL